MGKSPGKWIKVLLFGKKSSRSHTSKGRDASKAGNDKVYTGGKGLPDQAVNSPVISEPVLVSTERNVSNPELEKGASSNFSSCGVAILPTNHNDEKQGTAASGVSIDPEKIREEQAAIKAQAAFRGYLARRAFRALRGIIRLQALVRGHLVRRQAVATLRSMQGIVKFQALARGRRVRLSGIGLEVHTKFCREKALDVKPLDTRKEKLLNNAFLCKLLSSSPTAMPLQIRYGQGEPNSVWSWLELWTSSCFWKPLPQLKKAIDSKSQTRRGSYAMETESGRPKRSVRRSSVANSDSGSANLSSEPEKPKRHLKKISSSPVDSVQEHPQSELEKVKRSLRKVSNSAKEASDRPEVETEKPNCSLRRVSSSPSDIPNQGIEDSAEKMKKDTALTPESKLIVETASKALAADGPIDALHADHAAVYFNPLQSIDKEESLSVMNGDLNPKEEQVLHENKKTSKRRASFSAKSEYAENGLQSTPPLPSYMAATQSAKAKLRGQSSPRLGSDTVELNGFTRRHSLPSLTNGKLSSQSPRTQRLVQASKGAVKNDRSLLSSRDGNDKPILVEWRR